MPRVPPPTDDTGSANSRSKTHVNSPSREAGWAPTTKKEAGSLFRIPLKPLPKALRTTSSHHDAVRDRIIKDMEDFELMYTL